MRFDTWWPARFCTSCGTEVVVQSLCQHPKRSRKICAPRYFNMPARRTKYKENNRLLFQAAESSFQTLGARLCSSVNAGSNVVRSDVHSTADGTASSISSPTFILTSLTSTQSGLFGPTPLSVHITHLLLFSVTLIDPSGRAHARASTHTHTLSLSFSPHGQEKKR